MSIPLTVLVVDDSVIYRKLISTAIEEMPGAALMGIAPSGAIALKKIELEKPDLVLLDMIMPDDDGPSTLRAIKKEFPDVNVVMISGVEKKTTHLTLTALEAGALDFVAKPRSSSPEEAFAELKQALQRVFSAVREQASVVTESSPEPTAGGGGPLSLSPSHTSNRAASSPGGTGSSSLDRKKVGKIDVIAIGVSTGGPNALKRIVPNLSKDISVPILVVQHMPPLFTASLAQSLDRAAAIRVVEAQENQAVEKGGMYIAPGGSHMVVRKGGRSGFQLGLVSSPPVHNCRPAVDVLFRSVAMTYGGNVLGVILTGMGNDGAAGVAAIRRKGGYSLVQDEKSSVVWGMPGAVVAAGEADEICPEHQMAQRIMELVKKGSAT